MNFDFVLYEFLYVLMQLEDINDDVVNFLQNLPNHEIIRCFISGVYIRSLLTDTALCLFKLNDRN